MTASGAAPRVAALWRYPVKSLAGVELAHADVERCGFVADRRWTVVGPDGAFLTQREWPRMACIAAEVTPDGLVLTAPGHGRIAVARPGWDAEATTVLVWKKPVPAVLADEAAGAWLSAVLGTDCRLTYMVDPEARPVDPGAAYAEPHDRVSFADGFPILLTGEASLDDLNGRLANPLPMNRFRPNLVVTGAPAWAEDGWLRIAIGACVFRVVKPCSRCVMTSVDQRTGTKPEPKEPLRTLASFRRATGGVMFGQNVIPERLGRIAVGDPVHVLEEGPSNLLA